MSRPGPSLEQTVRHTLLAERLLPRGTRVLVGVSGGPDSVVLFHMLGHVRHAMGLTLHVAHVDHQLRPDSSEDARFVQRLGLDAGVGVSVVARDVRAACRTGGWSLEDGARRVRYEAFEQVARQVGAQAVAVAHTADDQAETVLLRLIQGTGTEGLAGMPLRRPLSRLPAAPWLIRPLLRSWRWQVLEYAAASRLRFRQDPSNADERFVRNRIRRELLPLLERRYNPNIRAALVQLADVCRAEADWLQDEGARQWKRLAKPQGPHRVRLEARRLLRQPAAVRRVLVRRALEAVQPQGCRLEFRHWQELDQLLRQRPEGSIVDLPGGARWGRRRGQLWCEARPGILKDAHVARR